MVEVDHQHNRGLFRLGGHWGCAGLDRGFVEGVVMGGRKGFGKGNCSPQLSTAEGAKSCLDRHEAGCVRRRSVEDRIV
jgi:hypothetical protein